MQKTSKNCRQKVLLVSASVESAETTITGMGTVNWHVRDNSGTMHTIWTKAYLILNAAAHLFSPLAYFQQKEHHNKGGQILFNDTGGSFVSQEPRARAILPSI